MKSDYTTNSRYITHTIAFWKVGRIHFLSSGVKGLMQISAYITHKNVAVYKIIEAMRIAYAKIRDLVSKHLKQNVAQMIPEHNNNVSMWKESTHHLWRTLFCCFANLVEQWFWNATLFSAFLFVGMHFQNFACKFVIHLCTVYASPQKLVWLLEVFHFEDP